MSPSPPPPGAGPRRLKIAIVSGILHPALGGPATVVARHARALQEKMDVTVFGVALPERTPEVEKIFARVRVFPATWPRRWFRGKGLYQALVRALPEFDVVHAHMLWDHPVWAASRIAQKHRIPFILTPHGSMMEPWRHRTPHKRLYRALLGNTILKHTAALHALNQEEEAACRRARVTTPIRIVPNGLEKAEFQQNGNLERGLQRWPNLRGKRVLLYLGRLWEGKGLGLLARAWANCMGRSPGADPRKLPDAHHIHSPNKIISREPSWILVLAGPDYRGFRQALEKELVSLGIDQQLFLPGPVSGEAKMDLLGLASGFVLPSLSEGFSMALLEGMAQGLPAIYTTGCHFPALAEQGGGIEVEASETGLESGLRQFFAMNPSSQQEMGQRGYQLAQSQFTMDRVAGDLEEIYREAITALKARG
ncbi:MAG: glycosyltransferase [Magnetococcales bacterium]|nr:glycosyltransferase [Magnetococcales bacterium]